jgi:hypothetical protein
MEGISMSLAKIAQSAALETVSNSKAAAAALEERIEKHNYFVISAVAQIQPLIDCLETLRMLDAKRNPNPESHDKFLSARGIDFDLCAPLAEVNSFNPLEEPEYDDPILVIKHGGVKFAPVYGQGDHIRVGREGNAINFFESEYCFEERRSVKTASAPTMVVKLCNDHYDVVTYLKEYGCKRYEQDQSLRVLDIHQLAEAFANWVGRATPNRMAEFAPALETLEASLPNQTLSAPTREKKTPNMFSRLLGMLHG